MLNKSKGGVMKLIQHGPIRLPLPLNDRFLRQVERLQCSKNAFVKMALVKFIEEEEAKEKQQTI